MSSANEISRDTIAEFMFVQKAMLSAREENANNTYEVLKERYIVLKATLGALGINITALDRIKE